MKQQSWLRFGIPCVWQGTIGWPTVDANGRHMKWNILLILWQSYLCTSKVTHPRIIDQQPLWRPILGGGWFFPPKNQLTSSHSLPPTRRTHLQQRVYSTEAPSIEMRVFIFILFSSNFFVLFLLIFLEKQSNFLRWLFRSTTEGTFYGWFCSPAHDNGARFQKRNCSAKCLPFNE